MILASVGASLGACGASCGTTPRKEDDSREVAISRWNKRDPGTAQLVADTLFDMMPYRSAVDKDINVIGPDGLSFSIDFDDVPHDTVEPAAEKMLRILNKYWDTET